jgi:hypothetical protein
MDAAARIQLRIDTLAASGASGIFGGGGVVAGLRMALADIEQAPPLTHTAQPLLEQRIAELQREKDELQQRVAQEVAFGQTAARERDQLRAQLAAEAERRRAAMLTAPAPPPPEPDVMLGQPHKLEAPRENQVQNPRAPGPAQGEPAGSSAEDADAEEPARVWTPERDEKLRLLKEAGFTWSDICAELNKLPGPAVSTGNAAQIRYSKLRMRAANPPPPPAPEKPSPVWTEERNALLTKLYTGNARIPAIVEELNALPGVRIDGVNAVYTQANKLGLKRALPVTATSPEAAPTQQDRHDHAKRLRRDGYASAAIAARTGLSMPEISDLHERALEEARMMLKGGSDSETISQACGLPAAAIAQLRGELAAAKTRAEALILLRNGASDDAVRQETELKPREIIALRAELRPSARAAAQ